MIPTDNNEIDGVNLSEHAINAQDVLDRIRSKKPLATIFILDCCRKYHLRNKDLDRRKRGEAVDQPRGLKAMTTGDESLILFACAAGATAVELANDRNGKFTKHLLRHIHSPNKSIYNMLPNVMKGVKEESKAQQIPYLYSSLTNTDLCLCETSSGKYRIILNLI